MQCEINQIKLKNNGVFPQHFLQNPASIDIQWSEPFKCQSWQDSVMIRQKMKNYRKTRIFQKISSVKIALITARVRSTTGR